MSSAASLASSSAVSSSQAHDAASQSSLEPEPLTIAPRDALVVAPSRRETVVVADPAFIRAQTTMWKRQQDDEDALRYAERMSQFRNCRSIIDLVASKKVPQMKVKLGGGSTATPLPTRGPPTAGNTYAAAMDESVLFGTEVETSAGTASGPVEAAALVRGCPSDRLSYLAIDPGLGSDDDYFNPVMDLGSVAELLPPKVVAVEVRPSASVQRYNQGRTHGDGDGDGLASSDASAVTLPPTATGTPHRSAKRLAASAAAANSSLANKDDASTVKARLFKQLEDARQTHSAPTRGPAKATKASTKSSVGGSAAPEENQWSRQEKLSTAMNLIKEAKQVVDPQRCYFLAGLLFDEVGQHERAVTCFTKALVGADPALVVDTYKLVETLAYHRKLRIMTEEQRSHFLAQRAALRERLIYEETRRQRLKVFLAHLKLTRLHVVFARHADTHASICTVFDLCESHAEHLFVLTFAHTLLSEMAYTPGVKELPLTRQLVRESAGPLAECHMWVLRDLLNEDVVRHDVLYEWLGRRYAETSDFLASRKYFKMARDIRQGIAVDVTKVVPSTRDKVLTANPDAIFGLAEYGEEPPISEYDRRWRGAGGGATGFDLGMQRHDFAVERYKKTAGVDMATNEFRKYPLKAHTWHAAADEVVDIRHAEARLDYSMPQKAHQAAATVLYAVPTQGWSALPDD